MKSQDKQEGTPTYNLSSTICGLGILYPCWSKLAIFLPSIFGKGESPKDKQEICKATNKENKITYFILISFCLSDRRSIFMNKIMYMMCDMFNITLQQIILEKLIQGLNLPFKMNTPTYSEIMSGEALTYGYKNLNKVTLSTSR